MDLTAFLLARIAEDEAAARAAQAHERALLEVKPTWSVEYAWAMMLNTPGGAGGGSHNFQPGAPSPARVLAECAAYREIVEIHHKVRDRIELENLKRGPTWGCVCYGGWPCATLRALASVWAGHPEFDPERRMG